MDEIIKCIEWIENKLRQNEDSGSFGLSEVPKKERKFIETHFKEMGYESYLYGYNKKDILIIGKD